MPRLIDPHTGSVVSVSDEQAKVLADVGYQPADEKQAKKPARKTADEK